MSNSWYVIKVFPGKERSMSNDLNEQISLGKIKNILRFVCPTESEYVEVKKKKVLREKALYSGYLYFETQNKLTDDELKEISGYPNVMGMMGDRRPMLMRKNDIDRIIKDETLLKHCEIKNSRFIIGESVTINEGPFSGFWGVVSKIKDEKVDVMVKIFGRDNQVSLTIDQIKKV